MGDKNGLHRGETALDRDLSATPAKDFILEEFEARLQILHDQIQNKDADWRWLWLKSEPHVFDSTLDLRAKVDAVRWMLRVAKHLTGPAQERIVLTVASSLDQLEKTVHFEAHAS